MFANNGPYVFCRIRCLFVDIEFGQDETKEGV
jgi:hypothetical protein